MATSKFFSGPPSNKATASTVATAAATLFWTIAAHTFWKSMSTADLTLYVTTSTVILTAIVGFAIPESAAYTQHSSERLASQQTAPDGSSQASPEMSTVKALEARVQQIQMMQTAIAARLGMAQTTSIPSAGRPAS